jgi:peptidoglycan/xylan/chitin deacetylase (PgdA/CDA1 family)
MTNPCHCFHHRSFRPYLLLVGHALSLVAMTHQPLAAVERIPAKTVVLTFDDSVKSHRAYVAPLLKELGFNATFYITQRWMSDQENFLNWQEVAEIHEMGFEIGNHSWTHDDFSSPRNAARLAGELALVDRQLHTAQPPIPRPVNFGYCGNAFGPETVTLLQRLGYQFARRGGSPEAQYGTLDIGPTYDPTRHHPLLIPTTGDAYPFWTMDHFKKVVALATEGQAVVLQFHGVPDIAHPWVHTPPERFREYMTWLKEQGCRCIAIRDLEPYIDRNHLPNDPLLERRQPPRDAQDLPLPLEMEASRRDARYWLENMLVHHRYTTAEAAAVLGWSEAETADRAAEWKLDDSSNTRRDSQERVRVLPYPGGRHPRIGFLDGALDPQRGTKVSFIAPWNEGGYFVLDLPEAIFSNLGLTYLAHTHIPTIWDQQNAIIPNLDWKRKEDGSLQSEWTLPNQIQFGATVVPVKDGADMELWLRNGTSESLTGLRTQICLMLKGAAGFNEQNQDRNHYDKPIAAARSRDGQRYVLLAFQECGRAWGNPPCPCLHSDPVLPDAAPGQLVKVRGQLRFYEGSDVDSVRRSMLLELQDSGR